MRQNNKIIHYFLDGDLNYDYRDSWKRFATDYELVKWDSNNIPQHKELKPYISGKRWSIISDFVRRWAILKFGGIYLDFDIELIKSPDEILNCNFVCIESPPTYANAAVTGGFKGNTFHEKLLSDYFSVLEFGPINGSSLETSVGPVIITEYVESLKGSKMSNIDSCQVVQYDNFVTLPKEYFFPFNWNEPYGGITEKTIGIHHWKKSW
jgi:mannosyltransferase OCH1-like enzyme